MLVSPSLHATWATSRYLYVFRRIPYRCSLVHPNIVRHWPGSVCVVTSLPTPPLLPLRSRSKSNQGALAMLMPVAAGRRPHHNRAHWQCRCPPRTTFSAFLPASQACWHISKPSIRISLALPPSSGTACVKTTLHRHSSDPPELALLSATILFLYVLVTNKSLDGQAKGSTPFLSCIIRHRLRLLPPKPRPSFYRRQGQRLDRSAEQQQPLCANCLSKKREPTLRRCARCQHVASRASVSRCAAARSCQGSCLSVAEPVEPSPSARSACSSSAVASVATATVTASASAQGQAQAQARIHATGTTQDETRPDETEGKALAHLDIRQAVEEQQHPPRPTPSSSPSPSTSTSTSLLHHLQWRPLPTPASHPPTGLVLDCWTGLRDLRLRLPPSPLGTTPLHRIRTGEHPPWTGLESTGFGLGPVCNPIPFFTPNWTRLACLETRVP